MKALILAGGLGTRLRPLTYTRPKHLLPIVNRPHIERVFDLLQRHGINEVVLLTSYLAEAFDETRKRAAERGMTIHVTHEPDALGTAGAIKNAEDLVGDSPFLVFNGDIVTDTDLSWFLNWHRDKGAGATILLTPVEDPSPFGVVPTDEDGRVRGFVEKPRREDAPTNLINAGVYVFEPHILQRIPRGEVFSAERELFPALAEEQRVLYAVGTDAYWTDIGTTQQYLRANMDALNGRYSIDGVEPSTRRDVALDVGGRIDENAKVSFVCIGAGSRVDRDAVVERSVLLPHVVVERGARITDSVIGEGAVVAPCATVAETAVADGERVDATDDGGASGRQGVQ